MIIKVEGKCQFEECEKPATHLASGRMHNGVACYCEAHAETVADERNPEYVAYCPNCNCMFGIN
jgi:hypothetical protein